MTFAGMYSAFYTGYDGAFSMAYSRAQVDSFLSQAQRTVLKRELPKNINELKETTYIKALIQRGVAVAPTTTTYHVIDDNDLIVFDVDLTYTENGVPWTASAVQNPYGQQSNPFNAGNSIDEPSFQFINTGGGTPLQTIAYLPTSATYIQYTKVVAPDDVDSSGSDSPLYPLELQDAVVQEAIVIAMKYARDLEDSNFNEQYTQLNK
jgi:uncharacterized membrane protein